MRPLLITSILALAMAVACKQADGHDNPPHTRGVAPERSIIDGTGRDSSGTYVLAAEWQEATGGKDSVRAVKGYVLFRNQKRSLTIGVGSADDCNAPWLIGGHIYTASTEGSATTISKDGEALFSYPAKEIICGMALMAGRLHTLGQNADSYGFTYRIDGTGAADSPSGKLVGDPEDSVWPGKLLTEDQGRTCFSYHVGSGSERRWYMVTDGEESEVTVPRYVSEVFDMRMVEGRIVYVCNSKLSPAVAEIHDGSKRTQCEHGGAESVSDCSLLPTKKGIHVKGLRHFAGKQASNTLWGPDGKIVSAGTGTLDYYTDGEAMASVSVDANGSVTEVRIGEKRFEAMDGRLLSGSKGLFRDGSLHLLLSPSSEQFNPSVWRNGASLAIPIDGELLAMEIIP